MNDAVVTRTLRRLGRSSFRSRFALDARDLAYLRERGRQTIGEHATHLLTTRVGAARPLKDGRQTPWRGHPVFVAQHATATCCRGCIETWHGIARGHQLTDDELAHLRDLVLGWLTAQLATNGRTHPSSLSPFGASSSPLPSS
ncbi:DUF4186 domain-containing protein [Microbacterium sp. STN6]|uniref:DUF4186 domain-containing protein n=1 Tax=Microbacterium sp. STN6 TaxID=2995588 RepID=UPI0022610122|nr:DUF4186 domain-containing protein [Microbacterium sp. STN6]MCX7522896.1 DUF4186 domain-containing protein [Microbacterium sp. STN6]